MSSLLPPSLGYTQTGALTSNQAQIIIGNDLTLSWTALGFGPVGQNDLVENVKFNLTIISGTSAASAASQAANGGGTAPFQKVATISFSAADIVTAIANSNTLTSPITMTLTPVVICNNGQSGNILVLASQPYT